MLDLFGFKARAEEAKRRAEVEAEMLRPHDRGRCYWCGAVIGMTHGSLEAVAFHIAPRGSLEAVEELRCYGEDEVRYGHYLCFRCMYLAPEERGKTPEEAYKRWAERFLKGA